MTKQQFVQRLRDFAGELSAYRKRLHAIGTPRVSKKDLRAEASRLADVWVEEIRSPLEHKYRLDSDTILRISEAVKRLHILSRPNNLVSSYLEAIDSILDRFEDLVVLKVQQSVPPVARSQNVGALLQSVADSGSADYLKESVDCASAGHYRASAVLAWCAVVHRLQKKLLSSGLAHFNDASKRLKAKTTGKYSKWNKEFNVSTLPELQTVFDNDLITVMEFMGYFDGNQSDRLKSCFDFRNQCAHPGQAPVKEPNLLSFFSDIAELVLNRGDLL